MRAKEDPGSEGRWRGGGSQGVGVGVGGPCNDLTAVVTFLISARFNYTVDEEGARPPPLHGSPFSSSSAFASLHR